LGSTPVIENREPYFRFGSKAVLAVCETQKITHIDFEPKNRLVLRIRAKTPASQKRGFLRGAGERDLTEWRFAACVESCRSPKSSLVHVDCPRR
jgi:hypothetical protein